MTFDISRRKLIGFGLASIVAAPVVVRATSIMKVRPVKLWADGGDVSELNRLWVGGLGTELLLPLDTCYLEVRMSANSIRTWNDAIAQDLAT